MSVHTYLLETNASRRAGRDRWPGGVVAEMERQGLLEQSMACPSIWLDVADSEILARDDVKIVHTRPAI